MKTRFLLLTFFVLPVTTACTQNTFTYDPVVARSSASSGYVTTYPTPTPTPVGVVSQAGKNVMPVTVGNCGAGTYINEPCVSVTICTPGTTNCQTIPNILLDTGSYGLRIFGSQISVPLQQVSDTAGRSLAECAQFVIGADWGPVKMADVVLGQESAARVPIHVIDSTFPGLPSDCTNPDVSPASAGYNGILGVGLFVDDCGSNCVNTANNRVYFLCSGATCTGTTVPTANQVSNPVAFMSQDNNGVILQLPALPSHETNSTTGVLLLGVGTQSNNSPTGLRALATDGNGYITANFSGQALPSSFIDSGTNTISFPTTANITQCSSSSPATGFYCPAGATSLSVALVGTNSATTSVPFLIGNADPIIRSNIGISDEIGSTMSGSFDFGLPFFFGKSVVTVIDAKSSTLGTGPLWAF